MKTTKMMMMMYSAIPRSAGSYMASHFIEAMGTAQRPLKCVSALRRFRCVVLAASHVPGLGQMRTILNARNFRQP
jgi:hypothetical protein